jgi:hypothetical protein
LASGVSVFLEMLQIFADPSNKEMNMPDKQARLTFLIIMNDSINTLFDGMIFKALSFLFEAVNDKIMRLFEAGLTNFFLKQKVIDASTYICKFKRINRETGPQDLKCKPWIILKFLS